MRGGTLTATTVQGRSTALNTTPNEPSPSRWHSAAVAPNSSSDASIRAPASCASPLLSPAPAPAVLGGSSAAAGSPAASPPAPSTRIPPSLIARRSGPSSASPHPAARSAWLADADRIGIVAFRSRRGASACGAAAASEVLCAKDSANLPGQPAGSQTRGGALTLSSTRDPGVASGWLRAGSAHMKRARAAAASGRSASVAAASGAAKSSSSDCR